MQSCGFIKLMTLSLCGVLAISSPFCVKAESISAKSIHEKKTSQDLLLAKISAAAALAQTQCFKEMYRDTNAYAQCLRNLRDASGKTASERLGTAYFGFVGALSYMRVGHINSEEIASEFLIDFRVRQKKIGLSDAALCSTVAGDCTVRIAQTQAIEAAPVKAKAMQMRCVGGICKLTPKE
jgi:hypothetical protein